MLAILMSWTDWLNPEFILQNGGFWLILLIVFLETGIFFGVFLPGDSLLLTAGLLCGTVYLDVTIYQLMGGLIAAGFLGGLAGYLLGSKAESYLIGRKENFWFRKKYLMIAERYYQKYGNAAFVIGRFFPVSRTFIPIVAGLVKAHWWKFVGFNLMGTSIWVVVMVGLGYWLGNQFPNMVQYLEFFVLGLILITSLPIILAWIKQQRKRKSTSASV